MMITNIRHTGIVVRDIEKAKKFYVGFLGLKLWSESTEKGRYIEKVVGIKGAVLKWAKLKIKDGGLVELLEYVVPKTKKSKITLQASNKLGCSHIAFTVKDINDFFARLKKLGFKYKNAPQLSPSGKAKVMYCYDPDGVILEIVEEIHNA